MLIYIYTYIHIATHTEMHTCGISRCYKFFFLLMLCITGETALHIAVVNKNLGLVKALLEKGADINGPRATGYVFRRRSDSLFYFGMSVVKHLLFE